MNAGSVRPQWRHEGDLTVAEFKDRRPFYFKLIQSGFDLFWRQVGGNQGDGGTAARRQAVGA